MRAARPLALLLLAPALGQDLYRRAPLLCDKAPPTERPSALDATIPEIQNTTQPGPPPTQSTEMCMDTTTTAGSAGHTFPSAYAGKYVTLRSVIVTASGLKKNDLDGGYWFAVQPLGSGDEYAGLEVYSELHADEFEQGDVLDLTGYVRDLGEEQLPHVLALMQGQNWYETTSTPELVTTPANYIVSYTHLELCATEYERRGTQTVPPPVVVPAETFGYGCTAEARKYEGMLVRIEGASVQPCDNSLTLDLTSPQVHATIRKTAQHCQPNTLPADVEVQDKFGQIFFKNEASGPASAYPLEARRLSPQTSRCGSPARGPPTSTRRSPPPTGAGGERSSAGDRPEARAARYDLERDRHPHLLARQLGAGAAHPDRP